MFVAILGDRQSTLPANWTKETAIAIAAEAAFDAVAGAGPGASLTFVGIAGDLVLRVPAGSRVREGGSACWATGRSWSLAATVPRSSSRSTACSATSRSPISRGSPETRHLLSVSVASVLLPCGGRLLHRWLRRRRWWRPEAQD
jgi:hypothetical protein